MIKGKWQQPSKRLQCLLGILFLVFIVFPVSSVGQYAHYADQTPAKLWMNLHHDQRAFFVLGFLAGIEHAYSEEGKVIAFTKNQSTKELSQHVYSELLSHPELREGPIGLIIANVLKYEVKGTEEASFPTSHHSSDIKE